jgi:chromate transport protein ChrA
MLYGPAAAFLAVLAINLPAYTMLPLVRWYERACNLEWVQRAVRGLTSVSVGLIFAATAGIGCHALRHSACWIVFLAVLSFRQVLRWGSLTSLLMGGAIGVLLGTCWLN